MSHHEAPCPNKRAKLDKSVQDDSSEIATQIAGLAINAEQQHAISDFIQATQEPVSVAVETLEDCHWDLLEAISRFGEDTEEGDLGDGDVDEGEDSGPPIIERIRSQSPPRSRRRARAASGCFHRDALHRATFEKGYGHPRCFQSALVDPVRIEHSSSTVNLSPVPLFTSPYDDKLWYTGFMRP